MINETAWLAGGAVLTEYAMGFVPPSIAGLLGSSAYSPIILKAGVAWGLGFACRKLGLLSPAKCEALTKGGFVSAMLDVFALVRGKLPTLFQPAGAVQAAAGQAQVSPAAGMSGIVGVPGAKYHPYFGFGTGLGQIVGYVDRN